MTSPRPSGQLLSRRRRRIRLTLLDRFTLKIDREDVSLPPQGERLLALLAVQDRPLPRAYVAGTLWPNTNEDRAHANLRSALWRINTIARSLVTSTDQSLELAAPVDVDLRAAVAIALQLIDPSRGARLIPNAAMLASELLPGWYDEWVLPEREQFRQLRLHALEALCAHRTRDGDLSAALRAGLAAVAGDQMRESAHRALIGVYLAEGNLSDALRQYQIFNRLSREHFGIEPSGQIKNLVAHSPDDIHAQSLSSSQGGTTLGQSHASSARP